MRNPTQIFVSTVAVLLLCTNVNGQTCTSSTGGPGTEITKMINRLGLGSDCGRCKALANEMDLRGPDWVRKNRYYVVQQIISNAGNLGHKMGPAKKLGVRVLVRRAIRKSIK